MSRIGRLLAGACLVAALSPATALAAPSSPTPVKRASGKLSLTLTGTSGIREGQATTADRAVRVSGVVRPYVPGQFVVVHAFMGHTLILNKRLGIRRSPGGTFGEFSARLQSRGSGLVFISVVRDGSTTLSRLVR